MKIKDKLDEIKEKQLYRELKVLESFQDVKVIHNGQELHLLGSNNYLSLNNDERINNFTKEAIDVYGTGAGGSRLTTGTSHLHQQLETQLAKFKATEAALLFGSGYMANVGVISSIADKSWTIFSDRYNHASIVDGILLSQGTLERYKHVDVKDLERRLKKSEAKNKMVITDAVFSMDGNIAPLKKIAKLCQTYKALLVVDDAHGFGVLGDNGKGISELFEDVSIDLIIGTLSKTIPSSGGYVAGKQEYIDWIKNSARSFIFSTALPAHVIASSIKALELIEQAQERRDTLQKKIQHFIDCLNHGGFSIEYLRTPIVPILIGDAEKTMRLQNLLIEDGIYIPGIRPPTVPKGTSRLRASINYNHTYDDLTFIAERILHHSHILKIIKD